MANSQTFIMIGLFDAMSVLVCAGPTQVILHVTVEAVDALVAIANSRVELLDPLHVPVIVFCAVPVGGLA